MDGRESTATSGPNYSPFYVQHRGMGPPGGVPGGLHGPPAGGYRQQLDAVSGGYAFHQPPFGAPAHIGQQGYHQNHVEASQHMAQQHGGGSQHMTQHGTSGGGGGGSQHMAQHSGGGGGSQHMVQHSAAGGGGGGSSQHMVLHNPGGGGADGGMDIGMGVAAGADAKGDQGGEAGQDEQVKKKRGRPRKYKPDGSVTLGLSPSPSTPHSSSPGMGTMVTTPGSGFGPGTGSGGSGSGALTEKRGRGRPPGSGKMQQLASLGKWFLGSVGTGFTPHVIIISAGEDVAARIMSFSQQGPRAICIISATGAVSMATLHQDSDSGAVTYEGRFEILCLSGSYLVVEEAGTRTRSGGLCIALCGSDHRVIGGSVSGVLTAAGTVQVIVGSFMYGGGSKKNKGKADQDVETEEQNGGGGEETPMMALPEHPHNMPPHPMSGWPPGLMNQMDPRSSPMYGGGSKQNKTKAEQDMEDEERNGDCVNYLKSGAPSRVVFYKQGSWCDFPEKIVTSIIDAFKGDKSSVVVVMDDQPLLIDFLSMTLVNLKTRKQRSVAWLDGTNNWSFPSSCFDEEVDESAKLGRNVVEGAAQDFVGDDIIKSPSDVAKQAMLEASPPVLQNSCALDILRKKIVHVERGSESFLFVQNLFLSGMGSFAVPNNILHIHRYSPKDIPAQRRLEVFEKQLRLTGQKSGNANAKYGWLGSGKQDIVSVIVNGFVSTGKNTHDTAIADGIYLSPENRAFTSVGLCDVDEKGVQYMLLCRAILGKTGVLEPGSQEEFLGIYDSGVDDCSNPNYYVMWPSHRNTNISLEYLISFRLTPKVQEYFLSLKGLWLRPPPAEVIVDPSILQPVLCQTDEGPTSPWISFRVLFETIQDSISSLARELLYRHYEELKENKITRDEMVKKMMIIVGEKLLLDSLTKLKYSPSLWYNSPAKNTSYPATLGSVCIGTGTDVVSATPSHDGAAPSVLLENCEPVNSTLGGSPTNAVRGQHSPTPSMCSESSSSRCTDSQDPFAPTVAPLGRDALVRSALLSVNDLDSAGPSMEYNGHDTFARSCSKGHDYHVSRPTLGNSASLSMEGLHSAAPGMTPEVHGALAPNRAHDSVAATPGAACQAYTPSGVPQFAAVRSMAPQLCPPRSMAPHLCAPRSMAPHLRVRSKMPKVPAKKTMPEANYSSAATVVPVICKPPSSSVLPKENGLPTSSKECMTSGLILQGPDCPANRTTKLQNTPNLKNVAPKNPAAQCGSNKNLPRVGVDDSSTAAYAAGRLITLSADGEKGL